MNYLHKFFILYAVFSLIAIFPSEAHTQENQPFAVVELFTSEGCSSCPIADKFLWALTQDAKAKGINIYTLGFHVDYWDYLGWKDPFSHASFTLRQRHYVNKMQLRSAYTPQMIVNGEHEFGGYRRDLGQKYITQALNTNPSASIKLSANLKPNTITIDYNVTNAPANSTLNFALVQQNAETKVPRGENAGKILKHSNAVLSFVSIDTPAKEGSFSLAKPKNYSPNNSLLIAFVQDSNNFKIVGATQIELAN